MADTEVRRLQLEIVMDETGAIIGAKNVSKANKKLEKSTEKTAKKMSGFTKTIKANWLGLVAALGGALVTIKKAFDFSKAFLEYRQGMKALARNTGQNADAIVSKLKEVSRGTIDNKNIMLAANRAVALNVTQDMDKVAQLMEIARLKGKAMGIDTTQAFNDMVTGIGRGCLSGETIIETDKGLKLLKEIIVGMKVKSFNFETQKIEFRKVKKVFNNGTEKVYEILFCGNHIEATNIHSFYTNKGWKKTRELKIGYELFTGNKYIKIDSIKEKDAIEIYDLSVDFNENYFANGILCHNSPLILDNLGIITKGWDAEAKAAGQAMDTQFILNKILKQGAVELSATGASALTNAERFQKLNATWSDARLRAGKFLTTAILPLVDGLTKVLTPAKGIEETTQELIVSQAEYTRVVKRLKDEQDNLTTAEEQNLVIRKQILELDILKSINEVNKAYKGQTKTIKTLNAVDKDRNNALDTLRDKITKSEDETIKLSQAEIRLLGIRQQWDAVNSKLTGSELSRAAVLNKISAAQVVAKDATVARTDAEQKLAGSVSSIASALKNKAITEEQLIGLDDELLKRIKERIPLLEKENNLTAIGDKNTIEKKTEELKGSVSDFYAFVDEQRKLDLLKEEESRQLALEGLAQHQLNKKEIKEIEAIENEEKRTEKMEQLLADNLFFEQLEKKHQENIAKIKADSDKKKQKKELAIRKAELAATRSSLGDISSLTSSSNKNLFKIGKTASIARAIINVFESVTKTMASVPFPFNIPFAALQSVAGFAIVDNIKSQTMAEGGQLAGPSHAQGGVNVNAEGGEYFVRKQNVTAQTLPVLTAINKGMSNLTSLSIPANSPIHGMQGGGVVNNRDNRRQVSIEKVEIASDNPEELFSQFMEFGEDMGVIIDRRG